MLNIDEQPERYCLSCWQSLRGVPSRKCPECGRPFNPADLSTTSAYPYNRSGVREIQVLIVMLAACAIVTFVWSAMGYSIVHDVFAIVGPGCCLYPLSFVALLVFVPVVFMHRRLTARWRVWGMVSPFVIISIALTHWPLRITFLLHKPTLTKLADSAQARGTSAPGGRVGIFSFRKVDVLWNGNVGFQLSNGSANYLVRRAPGAARPWFNTNWTVSIGDNWYLVYAD